MGIATDKDVCCVSAYEFTCPPDSKHFKDILMHYDGCCTAAKEVGTVIKMDLAQHPELATWMAQVQGRPR